MAKNSTSLQAHIAACLLSLLLQVEASSQKQCLCILTDTCWPSDVAWRTFNASVSGNLVATVPLAAPCHDSAFGAYNETACKALQDTWTQAGTHYDSSSSIMAPLFANRSCDPYTPRYENCSLGTYIDYAVDIATAEDVQHALAFVQKHNIRLNVRNTGHDYNGKSGGSSSLAIWTHNLKNIEVLTGYTSKHYTGPAMKIDAGVQAFEAYSAAHSHNFRVVGGMCPSVGLAGGYTQGGGHSALSSKHGLGADQTLSIEFVSARGKHGIATRDNEFSDLFWAMSGGGGGTYAVALSMIVKVHPDGLTTAGRLNCTSKDVSPDTWWNFIASYLRILPSIVDEGVVSLVAMTNETFTITPMTGPGVSQARMTELMLPIEKSLDSLGIRYDSSIVEYPTYYDHYQAEVVGFSEYAVNADQYGGRLVPRSSVLSNNSAVTNAFRHMADGGADIILVGAAPSKQVAGDVYNAVHPAWRSNLASVVVQTKWSFAAPWEDMIAKAVEMTEVLLPPLIDATPGSGVYLNEADFRDPNWKSNYYGANYDRLLEIKNKYDPDHIFYALTAVGSDYWMPQEDGRLCHTSNS